MTPQGRLLRKGDTASNNVDEVRERAVLPQISKNWSLSLFEVVRQVFTWLNHHREKGENVCYSVTYS